MFTRSTDTSENGYLYVHELQNLQLNADMVTLGVSHSGFGKYHEGEGIISMARGFFMAGSSSVLAALWTTNTFIICTLF